MSILPFLTYDSQSWSLNESQNLYKYEVFQKATERSILYVKRTNRVRNNWLRLNTGIADVGWGCQDKITLGGAYHLNASGKVRQGRDLVHKGWLDPFRS